MITISGNIIDPTPMMDRFPPASIERKIIQQLSSSQRMYDYDSPDQLHFELALRNQIILASRELNRSRLAFTTFRDSRKTSWRSSGKKRPSKRRFSVDIRNFL